MRQGYTLQAVDSGKALGWNNTSPVIFQIVAIIYAVKALKLGDSFKTPFIAMIIAVIGIIVSVLVIEMFSPMILYNMN